ncbi:hypothetical protein AB0C51_19775 [Streptomyces pathocidini]|uniref:hypothetical protein n=1 Tax=Streptomyces pathocidini TaxID=1650571 RepID=UPI0033ED61DF
MTDKVMLAAFETGIVETGMRNLHYGDRDSVGVFQQRPSQGWGNRAQCLDPDHAARRFFTEAVRVAKAHPDWSAGKVAQGVQRSAYPTRYDHAEHLARGLLTQIAKAVGGSGRH